MTDTEALRADIERTRDELSYDVDALADKVSPSSIAHRQTEKVKSRVGAIRDSLMGSASDVKDAGASAVDSAKDAGRTVVGKAKGNPVAVGLVVFGIGWLVSSLIPASDREKDVADTVKDKAQPLVSAAGDVAMDAAAHLKEPAMNAATAVKDSAMDAAASVKEQAQNSASDVADSAQESRDNLQV